MTPPIPFRTESAVGASTYGVAFMATACLLILAAAILVVARRRGWFTLSPSPSASASVSSLDYVSSKRVSPALTVHAIRFDGHAYLVVEAARGTQASVLPLQSAQGNEAQTP